MLIKLTGIHDDKLGSKDAKRIEGKRIDNDEVWERKIFVDAKDLRGQLEEFGIGEIINVKQVRNGKWWNISGFEKPTAELIERVKGTGSKSYQNTTSSGSGGAKSTWGGRTGEAYDRSSAIYLALDFLKTNTLEPAEISSKDLYTLADEVYEYIHNGINPTIDPLDPPV